MAPARRGRGIMGILGHCGTVEGAWPLRPSEKMLIFLDSPVKAEVGPRTTFREDP